MRIVFSLVLLAQFLFAEAYYAKVEPYLTKKLTSNVTGEVKFVNENMLGKQLSNNAFIIIDATIDKAELRDVEIKLKNSKKIVSLDEKVVANLEAVLKKKERNYKKTAALKIKSRLEKDKAFYDLVATQNSYNATLKELQNLKNSIADLQLRMTKLKKSIHDKSVKAQGYLLYSLAVKEGQVVNPGTPLAEVADISKGVLTLFVDGKELANIKDKTIYLDDKKTSYKVSRALVIADSVNISKYKVQIVIRAPKLFSKLVKVEFKDEK